MKDYIKKKMYYILMIISFSTLFSAVLHSQQCIPCENDSDCPPGMYCIIPEYECRVATIVCTEHYVKGIELVCYEENVFFPMFDNYCRWTGSQLDRCTDSTYPY